MPKHAHYPFSKPNPLQAEIHCLCLERNIDVNNAKGKKRTNPDLMDAIRQYEIDNPSQQDISSTGLFAQPIEGQELEKSAHKDFNHPLGEPMQDVAIESDAVLTKHKVPLEIVSESQGTESVNGKSSLGGDLAYITSETNLAELREDVNSNEASASTYAGPFYLQMLAFNLGTCLGRGVISPTTLAPDQEYEAVRPVDLFSRYQAYLPFSTGLLPNFSEEHVLVEVLLRPSEISRLQLVGPLYCLAEPIPVSRIQRLFFPSSEAIDEFRVSAEQFKSYFFPASIATVVDETVTVVQADLPESSPTNEPDPIHLHQMQQFDRQLGMFGFLKHASLLRANSEQAVQDFSTEFLIGLHEVNTAIVSEEGNIVVMSTLLCQSIHVATTAGQLLFTAIVQAIYQGQNEPVSYEWGTRLLKEVEQQCKKLPEPPADMLQLRVAQEQLILLQQGQSNFGKALSAIASSDGTKRELPKLPFTALILLCSNPGQSRRSEDKEAVLILLGQYVNRQELKVPFLDQLLAVLGLYYGYAQFPRLDANLRIDSPELANAAKPLHRLRFDIDQFADRVIIESVFRYSVEGQQIHDTLDYLRPNNPPATGPLKLPQRAFKLSASPTSTPKIQNQASGPLRGQIPVAPRFRSSDTGHLSPENGYQPNSDSLDSAVFEEIVLKMMSWFSPSHFEQQLMSGFTPAEQEALRILVQSRKNR